MYVIHNEVKGELIATEGHVIFVPEVNPYGKNRLTIIRPEIYIASAEDEDCIWVKGLIEVKVEDNREALYRYDCWSFYPIPREAKKKN